MYCRVSTTSRSTIASPSRATAVSPTVRKTRKKRKKITCPPLPRRQPAKRSECVKLYLHVICT